MVAVSGAELFAARELLDHLKQLLGILALLFCKLQILLELVCEPDLVPHESSAAFRSSMLV